MELPISNHYCEPLKLQQGRRYRLESSSDVPLIARLRTVEESNGKNFEPSVLWMLTWNCLPLAIISLAYLCSFSISHLVILFSPCLIGTILFFLPRCLNLMMTMETKNDYFTLIILTAATAQFVCDCFVAAFVYYESDRKFHYETKMENNDAIIGAIILIALLHALGSLSLFTKFVLKLVL